MKRRDFLGAASLFTAGSMLGLSGVLNAATAKRYSLGVQFFAYSGGRALDWEQFSAAMASARQTGFDGLQLAGLMGHAPERIAKRADELGLKLRSMHMGNDQVRAFRAPGGTIFEAQDATYTPLGMVQVARVNLPLARDLGCEWGMIAASGASSFTSIDAIRRMADALNKCDEVARTMGLRLSYHNHALDFTPVAGQVPFDVLLANTDPRIRFELDVCYVKAGGGDAVEVVNAHADRVVSFHLKDIDSKGVQATPGDGILDFAAIHRVASKVDDPLFYLEINVPAGADPLVEVSKGYTHLNRVGWGRGAA